MDVETTVPTQETFPELVKPATTQPQETAPETTHGTVATESTIPEETFVPETFETEPAWTVPVTEETIPVYYGSVIQETVAETTEPVVIVDVIESVGSDLAHVSLFGSFLVCGTLIGLQLLRDRHGN